MAGLIAIKMAFTGYASHHQRARSHQARPHPASGVDEHAKSRARSDQQIQVQQEKGLHGTYLANRVLYDEIPVIELRMKRILDQLVVSMILALVRESHLPAGTALQIVACDDFETPRKLHRFISRDG